MKFSNKKSLAECDSESDEDKGSNLAICACLQQLQTLKTVTNERDKKLKYEIPDDSNLYLRSALLQKLLVVYNLGEKLRTVTNFAFEAIDSDGSG